MPSPTRARRLPALAAAVALAGFAAAAAADYVSFGDGWGSKWDDPEHPSPAVITWGFVPDGTAVHPGFPLAPEVTGTSDVSALRATVDAEYGAGAFDDAVQRAFDTWELVAGVDFVGPVADVGGLAIGAPGATSPDVRIGAFAAVNGSGFSFLGAVGYGPPGDDPNWPDPVAGDVIFNLTSSFAIHPGEEGDLFYAGGLYRNDLEGLVLHELGHAAMGLGHPAAGPDEVMYVGAGCCVNVNRVPSPDDIAGARSVYGDSATPACSNGIDDDGDGDVDLADDGCNTVQMATEEPECSNGADDDGDALADFPMDSQCQGAWDDDEASNPSGGCGLVGAEALLLLPALRRRRRREAPSPR